MKFFISILIAISSLSFLSANTERLEYVPTYNQAIEKAVKENKVMLLLVDQQGCPACDYMKNIVLKDKDVVKELNKYYVVTKADKNGLPDGIRIKGTPTFFFYKPNGKRIRYNILGANKPNLFVSKLRKVRRVLLSK